MVPLGYRIPRQSCYQHDAACQGGTDITYRYRLSRVDEHRRSRYGRAGHRVFPRASIVPPVFFITTLIASIVGLKMV